MQPLDTIHIATYNNNLQHNGYIVMLERREVLIIICGKTFKVEKRVNLFVSLN